MMKLSAVGLLCSCVALSSGCATPKFLQKTGEDVAPVRGERREQALQQFEIHRDMAQYQAAVERWKSGDPFSCEAQLSSLIGRNPKHIEARQALADLAIERGELVKAEEQMRELLKLAPQHAQTHHSLGLLLEGQQRGPEAQEHLRRAATLEPDNMLYQLCAQPDLLAPQEPAIVATR